MITSLKTLDYETNSPYQCLGKCMESSMENMPTDVRVLRVNVTGSPVTEYMRD